MKLNRDLAHIYLLSSKNEVETFINNLNTELQYTYRPYLSVIYLALSDIDYFTKNIDNISERKLYRINEQAKIFLQSVVNLDKNIPFHWDQLYSSTNTLRALRQDVSTVIERIALYRFATEQRRMRASANEMNNEIQKLRITKNELEATLQEQKEKYEPLQTELELTRQVREFNKSATNYSFNAKWWVVGIIFSSLIFVWVIYHIKVNYCFDSSCFNLAELEKYQKVCEDCGQNIIWYEIFKGIFYRLIMVSTSLYLISFCIKNYNASMHNKVINETKANSFAYAIHIYRTTTGTSKEEIMIKGAESIFAHRNTGYNGKSSEPVSPSIVQNIVDKVTPGK